MQSQTRMNFAESICINVADQDLIQAPSAQLAQDSAVGEANRSLWPNSATAFGQRPSLFARSLTYGWYTRKSELLASI